MNMLAATGRKITVSGTRTCLPTICRFHVTTAKIRLVLKSARAVRCINVKMVLLWSMKILCIGCRYCHMACPYGAPQYNETKGHMTKCDGCYDRVAEGKSRSVLNLVRCGRWISALSTSCVKTWRSGGRCAVAASSLYQTEYCDQTQCQ